MFTHLIAANVTVAVVAFGINVLGFVLLIILYVMVTRRSVPVSCSAFFVNPLGFVEFVVTELIVTKIANTVVAFFVYVSYKRGGVIRVTGVSVPVTFSV